MSLTTLYYFLCTLLCATFSKNLSFDSVTIQYQTVHFEEFVSEISVDSLKEALEVHKISRISVVGDSKISTLNENSISDLPNLKVLQIRQHGLEHIQPGTFKNVPNLEVVRLQGNKIKTIEENVFNNLNLVFLNLELNLIESVAARAFDNLTKLEALDLSYNKIQIFYAQWLAGKPLLKSMNCAYNEIKGLPEGTFQTYRNDIDLSNNKIGNLTRQVFGTMEEKRLGTFFISDNYIEELDDGVFDNVKLITFDVSGNKLKCLDVKVLVARKIKLDGNPWKCDCLNQMKKWAHEHPNVIQIHFSNYNCTLN